MARLAVDAFSRMELVREDDIFRNVSYRAEAESPVPNEGLDVFRILLRASMAGLAGSELWHPGVVGLAVNRAAEERQQDAQHKQPKIRLQLSEILNYQNATLRSA